MNSRELSETVFTLYENERFSDALALVEQAGDDLPDRAEVIAFWRACLSCKLGEVDRALEILQRAIDDGLWWDIERFRRDPDLEPLRSLPAFAEIVAESERRFAAARAAARTSLDVYRPSTDDETPPLVFALSWRARHLGDFTDWWKPVVEQGAILAVPRSSQINGMHSFGWDDREIALRDIRACVEMVESERFGRDRVVLAGASQGGELAIRLALGGEIILSRGFIVVVPAIRNIEPYVELTAGARDRGVRGWIVTGELDPGRDAAIELAQFLNANGIPCNIDVIPGIEHDFPPDFETRLPSVLSQLLSTRRQT